MCLFDKKNYLYGGETFWLWFVVLSGKEGKLNVLVLSVLFSEFFV